MSQAPKQFCLLGEATERDSLDFRLAAQNFTLEESISARKSIRETQLLDLSPETLSNEELLELCSGGNNLKLPFTGERVVPGSVEPQLWNEHISRYRFASLFAKDKRVLDAGCGTGYGTELLARSASYAIGFDSSEDAIHYAKASFNSADYIYGSASAIPLSLKSVDLVTAFEVIEHLSDWELLLEESARVLTAGGVFLVSTPNREYYAEARGLSGHNPFHVHEFEFEEFEAALKRVFPFVQILAQNQQETVTFCGDWQGQAMSAFIPPTRDLTDSHFFLAVCSFRPVEIPFFADISSTHNLLRDRERHIRGLQGELRVAQSQLEAVRLEKERLEHEQQEVRNSAWVRLGRALGIGPWSDYRARIRIAFDRVRERRLLIQSRAESGLQYVGALLLYIASPLMLAATALTLAMVDVCFAIGGRKRLGTDSAPSHSAASIVIPSWNGLELLQANLPSLMEAIAGIPGTEVIVVDNGSTDESVNFLKEQYPHIRLLALPKNIGFAGACNLAAKAAVNDVVLFLNNDMRVEKDFLPALLRRFSDPLVFAVSSQIFFADPKKLREETGLTEVWWDKGQLGVGHRVDPLINDAYPCAYPGGGSSAFDRAKFLELGGFDRLFHPFYYEDTDLGYMAWKRGWKVLYQPASIVYHEHRGTIGKTFSPQYIDGVVRKNAVLYCWKNIHDWKLLSSHFRCSLLNSLASAPGKPAAKPCNPADVAHAFSSLAQLAVSRWRARELQKVSDTEAFRRPLGGYYRDRFVLADPAVQDRATQKERLNVLLVSPYPIEPPTHGGAVFMRETVAALGSIANVHVVSFVDNKDQLEPQRALLPKCSSGLFLVRPHFSLDDQWTLVPNAIREFGVRDFAWAVHRTILQQKIDVLQLEYTIMGQYAGAYRNIPCMLFEHDISAQSLWRRIKAGERDSDLFLEYIRMRMYEPRLLKGVTRVQVCSADNARYLRQLAPGLNGRVDCDLRASIDVQSYDYSITEREPNSLLFIGSFRHLPNVEGLKWFIREVFPLILKDRPETVLNVVGSDPPASWEGWTINAQIRLLGSVPDVKVPLRKYSVFICPVLSGSGVRVKLLEAFASGMPAVATTIGAEGLASNINQVCETADSAAAFARSTLRLLKDEEYRKVLAGNARSLVERNRDSHEATTRLEALYRKEIGRMRGSLAPSFS